MAFWRRVQYRAHVRSAAAPTQGNEEKLVLSRFLGAKQGQCLFRSRLLHRGLELLRGVKIPPVAPCFVQEPSCRMTGAGSHGERCQPGRAELERSGAASQSKRRLHLTPKCFFRESLKTWTAFPPCLGKFCEGALPFLKIKAATLFLSSRRKPLPQAGQYSCTT